MRKMLRSERRLFEEVKRVTQCDKKKKGMEFGSADKLKKFSLLDVDGY